MDSTEIAVIDELGVFVSTEDYSGALDSTETATRCPISCSKQARIAADWLKEHFEENIMTSVSRSELFEEYISYCCEHNVKPFNQAVFGKVVRACFPNLTTRRLGVRGHSRYHYAGLNVKRNSQYSDRFCCYSKKYNLYRFNSLCTRGRYRDMSKQMIKHTTADKFYQKSKYRYGSVTLLLPPHPTIDDLLPCSEFSKSQTNTFLSFYRCYNQQLLKFVISLDFEKTYNHILKFSHFLHEKCHQMVRSDFICDVMVIYDDIMYQEANKALLPDSLATLTNEFSVTIRKFAKTISSWIAEGSNCLMLAKCKATEKRIQLAKQWGEHVRRVTTLCHVTKEARKTLVFPNIVLPLLSDLKSVPIQEIASQCAFAGGYGSNNVTTECMQAQFYMKRFCDLLQGEANIETYAAELEMLVDEHAGLKDESLLGEKASSNMDCLLATDQTRIFLMKWAAYGSKILTEITLKTSESVGPFHLVMLLFGDYINHVITLKNEQAKRINRLKAVIRKDSSYFQRLWESNTENSSPALSEFGNSEGSSLIKKRMEQPTFKPNPLPVKQEPSVFMPSTVPVCSNLISQTPGCSGFRSAFTKVMPSAKEAISERKPPPTTVILQQSCSSCSFPSA